MREIVRFRWTFDGLYGVVIDGHIDMCNRQRFRYIGIIVDVDDEEEEEEA